MDLDNNADSNSMCVRLLKIALVLMVCTEPDNKVVFKECVDLDNNADSDSICVRLLKIALVLIVCMELVDPDNGWVS